MQTSTKVILAGLAAFCGLSLYSKSSNGSLNPFALVGDRASGPPLPKKTPSLPAGTAPAQPVPQAPPTQQASNSPEVQSALAALQSFTQSFPNSPEVQAAVDTLRTAPPSSPEAQAATTILQGMPASPEAKAALGFLSTLPTDLFTPQPAHIFVPGVIDEPVIRNGDIVNVDAFSAGFSGIPAGVPLVGLVFMHVDSLEGAGDPSKFLGTFQSAELRVFGQQTVNRSAIRGKG